MTAHGLRDRLRAGLRDAMRARDKPVVAAIRSALAAIDNAEAVPLDPSDDRHRAGAVEASAVGVGAAEAERRVLTEGEVVAVVELEVRERMQAVAAVGEHSPERADAIRAEVAALTAFLRAD